MSFTTLQNTPIILDLAQQARSTGWTISGNKATHESCNAGFIILKPNIKQIISGNSYTISYQVSNRTSGMIQLSVGNTLGISRTTDGNYTETLIASGVNPLIKFYSDGNLELTTLDIRENTEVVTTKQTNTIAYSELTDKWTSFYSFTSDYGFSFFKDLFTMKAGRLYKHDQTLTERNNIYGIQYNSIFKFISNANIGQVKSFESLSYEGNQLLITTTDGIITSLGQVSELVGQDFLKETLSDGVSTVFIYDNEGIYSAAFVREKNNGDIINGNGLKGTHIMIELVTSGNTILKLRNVMINSVPSHIGVR